MLEYVQKLLLEKFGAISNLQLTHKKGEQDSIINGRLIIRTKNLYALNISNFKGTKNFFNNIGFSITRKQEKLKDAIEIIENFSEVNHIDEWEKRYVKMKNKHWKKIHPKLVQQIECQRLVRDSDPGHARDRGVS